MVVAVNVVGAVGVVIVVCVRVVVKVVALIITSAKEVMFLSDFVCLSVCLCVSKITQKVMDGSFCNFEGMSGMA